MSDTRDRLEKIVVAAGIVCRHGLFLATQRRDDKPMPGYWELPGGKLEGNETPDAALCRELAEELGINVLKWQPVDIIEHDYPERGFTAVIHFFRVLAFTGEPCPNENQNLRWIGPEDIAGLDFLPADKKILDQLSYSDFDVNPKKVYL